MVQLLAPKACATVVVVVATAVVVMPYVTYSSAFVPSPSLAVAWSHHQHHPKLFCRQCQQHRLRRELVRRQRRRRIRYYSPLSGILTSFVNLPSFAAAPDATTALQLRRLSTAAGNTDDSDNDDDEYDDGNYDYNAAAKILDDIRNFYPDLLLLNSKEEEITTDVLDDVEFLRNELMHLESLEDMIFELENFSLLNPNDEDDDMEMEDEGVWDDESLDELLNHLPPLVPDGVEAVENDDVFLPMTNIATTRRNHNITASFSGTTRKTPTNRNNMNGTATNSNNSSSSTSSTTTNGLFYQNLEQVLLQGVVPVQAGVGSECLVGDFGFDPLQLSQLDLFRPTQDFFLSFLPSSSSSSSSSAAKTGDTKEEPLQEMLQQKRPRALILRDYREAEIRHGRLAMLAAMIWPLQEMVDQFILSPEQFGPILYGPPVTLPYFPLAMTAIMLLLGYLDIYSQAIKDLDQIGDAFLPGDCFWDPLQVLVGAPETMKRNMQERELFNGRAAMIAIGAYIVEESITHKALIEIGSNALLLQPAYVIPFVQKWLDKQFMLSIPAEIDPTVLFPTLNDDSSMLLDTLDALIQTTTTMLFP